MIISNDESKPIIIDDLDSPIKSNYFWTLNLTEMDFQLSRIKMLECINTPALVIEIMGYVIKVPASWHILASTEDTHELDTLVISDCTKGLYTALVMNHRTMKQSYIPVRCIDYIQSVNIYTIALHRNQMMCHALGPNNWIMLSGVDVYSKYLKNKTVWDII
jgi:hypothetical protein